MNKAISIHLAQIKFSIDEKGYLKLKLYLKSLEQLFQSTLGKEEIIEDIESRIAELFSQYKNFDNYVISEKQVEIVIQTLGSIEDLAGDEILEENTNSKITRKFFRDPDDYWLGGVAGGVSKYFALNILWVRLVLFILFVFGVPFTILTYILIWIFVPEAKTTADKIKMKGEPVNISSIKNKIKEEYEELSDSVKKGDYKKTMGPIQNASKSSVNFFLKIIPIALRTIAFFFGIILVFISFLSLIGLIIGGTVGGLFLTSEIPFTLSLFGYGVEGLLIFLTCVFVCGIPFVFLLNLALILLTGKPKIRMNSASVFVLIGVWISTLIIIILIVTLGVINLENYNSIIEAITFSINKIPLHQFKITIK